MIFDDLKKSKKRTLDGVRLPIEYLRQVGSLTSVGLIQEGPWFPQ